MMEPRVKYAKTEDGVSIAYCVLGEGPLLVYSSNVWGDLQWYINDEASRRTVDSLVDAGWRVVRYDGRGTGSSDRDVTDFSLAARLRDLEAVVDRQDEASFALCGYGQGGPAAIAFGAHHPNLVSHLVLVNAFASGAAYYEKIPAMRALIDLQSMAQDQWEFFTITLASAATGFQNAERAKATAHLFRKSMTADSFMAYVEAARQIDVTSVLPRVTVETLVVEDTSGFVTEELSRRLASAIPNASFVTTDTYTKELHRFVSGTEMSRAPAATASGQNVPRSQTGLTVILFADIANSTALTERFGDAAFREKARALDEALRDAITNAGGTAVEGKLLGDGVLAVFSSARDAIACATDMHRIAESGGAGPSDQPPATSDLRLHVGIHAGDVIREGGPGAQANVFGGAVNIAARVSDASGAGETFVSQTLRDLARTSAGVAFDDRGEHTLKGVSEPVRLWSVRND